jgi:hypothetical protein
VTSYLIILVMDLVHKFGFAKMICLVEPGRRRSEGKARALTPLLRQSSAGRNTTRSSRRTMGLGKLQPRAPRKGA